MCAFINCSFGKYLIQFSYLWPTFQRHPPVLALSILCDPLLAFGCRLCACIICACHVCRWLTIVGPAASPSPDRNRPKLAPEMCQNISTKSTTPGGKLHVVARSQRGSNQLVIYVDVCAYLLVVTTLYHPRHTHHTRARTRSPDHRHTHSPIHSSEWLMGSLCWATEYIGNWILLVAAWRLVYCTFEQVLMYRINPREFVLKYLNKLKEKTEWRMPFEMYSW